MAKINVGDTLICHETGKQFTAEKQGCTFNYATDSAGNVFSDEGVDLAEKKELRDRSRPMGGYLSCDGKRFTGWKENILGYVVRSSIVTLTHFSYTHGKTMQAVRVRDIHGALWYGRGSPGIHINLRPMKG